MTFPTASEPHDFCPNCLADTDLRILKDNGGLCEKCAGEGLLD